MDTIDACTRCHARLATLAAFCSRCGQIVNRQSQAVYPGNLRVIADRQRGLLRVFFAYVVLQIAVFFPLAQFNFGLGMAVLCLWVVVYILMLVCILSLARVLEYGWPSALLMTLVSLFPIVNLAIVLILIRLASLELRDAGVRVGFLGARRFDVESIINVNRCKACGYDLRGLTSRRCPECGVAFSAPGAVALAG